MNWNPQVNVPQPVSRLWLHCITWKPVEVSDIVVSNGSYFTNNLNFITAIINGIKKMATTITLKKL